ncbi:MAG: hypothetical protein JO037_26715 [Actinobacteria bacterium]|nr:hypothetical protein [Actinomycetota bacterium]
MPPLLAACPDAAYRGEGGLLLGVPMREPHVERTSLPEGSMMVLMTGGPVEERLAGSRRRCR